MNVNDLAYAAYTMPYGEYLSAAVRVGNGEFIIRDVTRKADSIEFKWAGTIYNYTVREDDDTAYLEMVDFTD